MRSRNVHWVNNEFFFVLFLFWESNLLRPYIMNEFFFLFVTLNVFFFLFSILTSQTNDFKCICLKIMKNSNFCKNFCCNHFVLFLLYFEEKGNCSDYCYNFFFCFVLAFFLITKQPVYNIHNNSVCTSTSICTIFYFSFKFTF